MNEAIAMGKTRYFTGVQCPQGHVAERLVSTRACAACAAERKRLWNAKEPEKRNAQKRAWRDANLEKVRALNIANQKKHRAAANARNRKYQSTDRVKALKAEWQRAHPEIGAEKAARRRAAKLRATPGWVDQERINCFYEIAQAYREAGIDCHVDHVVPLQGRRVCGLHVHENLQVIPAQVNRSKSNHF